MKHFKATVYATILVLTISSTSLAGTIVGARANNRTGTMVGARTGTIVGARTGNIAGTRTGVIGDSSRRPGRDGAFDFTSLISENVDGIIRLLLTRTLF